MSLHSHVHTHKNSITMNTLTGLIDAVFPCFTVTKLPQRPHLHVSLRSQIKNWSCVSLPAGLQEIFILKCKCYCC